jgi:D-alanine-D-alanine ligase-like ATP-grasp enzyme
MTTPFLRRLREACELVGARLEVIPGSDSSGRITLPSGRIRFFHRLQWDLNTLGAAAIAVDKDATMRVLKRSGHTVPTGRSFYYVGRMREKRDIGGAYAYAKKLGLPVLLKPNDSSSDQHVTVAYTRAQFYSAAREVFAASKKLLVQRIARGSDCSIVVLDGEVLMASEKTRPYVIGDGRSSIRELIAANQRRSRAAGHPTELRADDARVERHLAHTHRTLSTVPRERERVDLLPCGNLGVGGDVREVTELLHPTLRDLAIRVVRDVGLRIASVDFVLSRPSDEPPKRCTVLEVNSAPGLDTHERAVGWSRRRVDRMSRIVLALDVGSLPEVNDWQSKPGRSRPPRPRPRRRSTSTSPRRRRTSAPR